MTYLRLFRNATRVTPIVLILTASAMAEWKAANSEVAAAAKEPKIASVLEAVNVIDEALIKDDHAAFAAAGEGPCCQQSTEQHLDQGGDGAKKHFRVDKLQQLCAVRRVRGDA